MTNPSTPAKPRRRRKKDVAVPLGLEIADAPSTESQPAPGAVPSGTIGDPCCVEQEKPPLCVAMTFMLPVLAFLDYPAGRRIVSALIDYSCDESLISRQRLHEAVRVAMSNPALAHIALAMFGHHAIQTKSTYPENARSLDDYFSAFKDFYARDKLVAAYLVKLLEVYVAEKEYEAEHSKMINEGGPAYGDD